MYLIPMKKVGDIDPKKLDQILKIKVKGEEMICGKDKDLEKDLGMDDFD